MKLASSTCSKLALSGFLLFLEGPVHWVSNRQSITAQSLAKSEIYAMDECTKSLQHLSYIIDGFNLTAKFMPSPTTIYNDNSACVNWSKNTTTKGLRHIQIRENAVRESCVSNFIEVKHISGNLSDLFTKEDKDVQHFISIRDLILLDPLINDRQSIISHSNRHVRQIFDNYPSNNGGVILGLVTMDRRRQTLLINHISITHNKIKYLYFFHSNSD
jgi:hypothetical protein